MNTTPVPAGNEEMKNLFAEKGELITQLELGQNKLAQVNARLSQLLGLPQPQMVVQPPQSK